MVSSHMVLLPALSHIFLLSLYKNDSMNCCCFVVSGKEQMRNNTNAGICAPAWRNEEKPAKKSLVISALNYQSAGYTFYLSVIFIHLLV